MPRLSNSRSTSRPRRSKEWAEAVINIAGATTLQTIDLLAAYRGVDGDPSRATLKAVYWQANPSAAGGTPTFSSGWTMGIIKGDLATPANVPNPNSNTFQDWIIRKRYFSNAVLGGTPNGSRLADDHVLTGRKLNGLGETFYMAWMPIPAGATSMSVEGIVRVLLWLA